MAKLETLTACGYCFLKELGNNDAIYENKFTGLRILYNYDNYTFKVMED